MNVTDYVYFGDMSDLLRGREVSVPTGGTIIYRRETCRKFIPGVYRTYKFKDNAIMFCLESVDPEKIHNYLLSTDIGEDFRAQNYVNRYDWMNHRNFLEELHLEEEYKNKLYGHLDQCFITTDNTFYTKNIDIVQQETNIYQVLEKYSKTLLSYICDIKREGEWNYAALLLDKNENKHFAFVLQDYYTLTDKFKDPLAKLITFDGIGSLTDFYL